MMRDRNGRNCISLCQRTGLWMDFDAGMQGIRTRRVDGQFE